MDLFLSCKKWFDSLPENFKDGLIAAIGAGIGVGLGIGLDVGLGIGLGTGLVFGLVVGLVVWLGFGFGAGFGAGLGAGVVYGLVVGLVYGLFHPIFELIPSLIVIVLIMEFIYWIIDKTKPKKSQNKYLFVLQRKAIAFGIASYIVVQIQGIIVMLSELFNWLNINQVVINQFINLALVWLGIGGLIIIGIVVFIWINSLKFRSK